MIVKAPEHQVATRANYLLLLLTSSDMSLVRDLDPFRYLLVWYSWICILVSALLRVRASAESCFVTYHSLESLRLSEALLLKCKFTHYFVYHVISHLEMMTLMRIFRMRLFRRFWIPLLVVCYWLVGKSDVGCFTAASNSHLSLWAGWDLWSLMDSFEVGHVVCLLVSLGISADLDKNFVGLSANHFAGNF